MADQIRMNFPDMEAMSQEFQTSASMIAEARDEMADIAQKLSDDSKNGGLLGLAGVEFDEALTDPLRETLTTLEEKFIELSKDIDKTVEEFQEMSRQEVSSKYQN